MSKITLQPNANGTGTFTIAAPDSNTNRTLTLPDAGGEVLTDTSDIEAQVKTATSATGTAPIFACRAWVNFDGTGTVAIRASGNVSSITDNGTGNYTINFATAMPDANYSVVGSNQFAQDGTINNNSSMGIRRTSNALLTGSVSVMTGINSSFDQRDSTTVCVSIFR